MVVNDIRAPDERADDRSVLAHVRIFKPVDDARDKVGEHDHEPDLKHYDDEFYHTPGWVMQFRAEVVIDKTVLVSVETMARKIGRSNQREPAGSNPPKADSLAPRIPRTNCHEPIALLTIPIGAFPGLETWVD